jgi:hypothetical protein
MRLFNEARVRVGIASAVAILSGSAFLMMASGAPAGATYPPTLIPTSCSNSQTVSVGGSATVTDSCTFAPGTTITITLNGAAYSTATAPASGVFTETFTATDPHIAMNGGPAVETAFGATNTFVATGTNASGASNVATTLVTIPAAASTTSSSSLAFTGTDLAATVVGGAALLAMGFALVMFARRRGELIAVTSNAS